MESRELALMKAQLRDIEAHPGRYEAAMRGGYVCAGFGGDLNGVQVPETFMSGRLPPGTTPAEALAEVIAFMKKTIVEAELAGQKTERIDGKPVLGIQS